MTENNQNTDVEVEQFDIDDVFDNAGQGGSGAPSYEWPKQPDPKNKNRNVPIIGGDVVGEIVDIYVTVVKDPQNDNKPKLDKRGRQQPQINLTLQTEYRNWERVVNIPTADDGETELPPEEDTGLRRIYVKHRMTDAIAAAIKASGQKPLPGKKGPGGPRKGAKVAVKVTDLIYSADKLRHPAPDYEAQYKPPVEVSAQEQQADDAFAAHESSAPAAGWGDDPPF